MDDAEFDSLKDDLSWNGSDVVNLNRKEITYLEAMQAYTKGEPTLSDSEYDALKAELKEDGSSIAVSSEPKCYIEVSALCSVAWFQPIVCLVDWGIFGRYSGNKYENIFEDMRSCNDLCMLCIGVINCAEIILNSGACSCNF